jgi:hypothetical protein
MPGQAGFTQRVLTPLAVIVATVLFLGGVGWKLAGLSGGSSASASPTAEASESPTQTPSAQATAATEQLSVQVFNGTSTAGLARRTADQIEAEGWVIAAVSNWSGAKVTRTTVYYPEGYADQAGRVAELVDGVAEPADALLPKNLLTLVVVD